MLQKMGVSMRLTHETPSTGLFLHSLPAVSCCEFLVDSGLRLFGVLRFMSELYWRNEPMFWEVLQTTPSEEEVIGILRGVRHQIVSKMVQSKDCQKEYETRLIVINDKLKYAHEKMDLAQWRVVLIDLWGDDGWKKALAHKRRLFSEQQKKAEL